MSLIKKSDLKNHLSTRANATRLPFQSSSKPDATAQPGNQSTGVKETVPVSYADRGSAAPTAAASTLPPDVANEGEASVPSPESGMPAS